MSEKEIRFYFSAEKDALVEEVRKISSQVLALPSDYRILAVRYWDDDSDIGEGIQVTTICVPEKSK